MVKLLVNLLAFHFVLVPSYGLLFCAMLSGADVLPFRLKSVSASR
jgi:hypothetical protein